MQALPKDGMNFLLVHDESFNFNSVCTVKYSCNYNPLKNVFSFFNTLYVYNYVALF